MQLSATRTDFHLKHWGFRADRSCRTTARLRGSFEAICGVFLCRSSRFETAILSAKNPMPAEPRPSVRAWISMRSEARETDFFFVQKQAERDDAAIETKPLRPRGNSTTRRETALPRPTGASYRAIKLNLRQSGVLERRTARLQRSSQEEAIGRSSRSVSWLAHCGLDGACLTEDRQADARLGRHLQRPDRFLPLCVARPFLAIAKKASPMAVLHSRFGLSGAGRSSPVWSTAIEAAMGAARTT